MTNSTLSPTPKQLDYIAKLSKSRGVSFGKPRTLAAASQQIQALKAMGSSRVERRREADMGRQVRPVRTAVEFRESEIEGYGASCTWSRGAGAS